MYAGYPELRGAGAEAVDEGGEDLRAEDNVPPGTLMNSCVDLHCSDHRIRLFDHVREAAK